MTPNAHHGEPPEPEADPRIQTVTLGGRLVLPVSGAVLLGLMVWLALVMFAGVR